MQLLSTLSKWFWRKNAPIKGVPIQVGLTKQESARILAWNIDPDFEKQFPPWSFPDDFKKPPSAVEILAQNTTRAVGTFLASLNIGSKSHESSTTTTIEWEEFFFSSIKIHSLARMEKLNKTIEVCKNNLRKIEEVLKNRGKNILSELYEDKDIIAILIRRIRWIRKMIARANKEKETFDHWLKLIHRMEWKIIQEVASLRTLGDLRTPAQSKRLQALQNSEINSISDYSALKDNEMRLLLFHSSHTLFQIQNDIASIDELLSDSEAEMAIIQANPRHIIKINHHLDADPVVMRHAWLQEKIAKNAKKREWLQELGKRKKEERNKLKLALEERKKSKEAEEKKDRERAVYQEKWKKYSWEFLQDSADHNTRIHLTATKWVGYGVPLVGALNPKSVNTTVTKRLAKTYEKAEDSLQKTGFDRIVWYGCMPFELLNAEEKSQILPASFDVTKHPTNIIGSKDLSAIFQLQSSDYHPFPELSVPKNYVPCRLRSRSIDGEKVSFDTKLIYGMLPGSTKKIRLPIYVDQDALASGTLSIVSFIPERATHRIQARKIPIFSFEIEEFSKQKKDPITRKFTSVDRLQFQEALAQKSLESLVYIPSSPLKKAA